MSEDEPYFRNRCLARTATIDVRDSPQRPHSSIACLAIWVRFHNYVALRRALRPPGPPGFTRIKRLIVVHVEQRAEWRLMTWECSRNTCNCIISLANAYCSGECDKAKMHLINRAVRGECIPRNVELKKQICPYDSVPCVVFRGDWVRPATGIPSRMHLRASSCSSFVQTGSNILEVSYQFRTNNNRTKEMLLQEATGSGCGCGCSFRTVNGRLQSTIVHRSAVVSCGAFVANRSHGASWF